MPATQYSRPEDTSPLQRFNSMKINQLCPNTFFIRSEIGTNMKYDSYCKIYSRLQAVELPQEHAYVSNFNMMEHGYVVFWEARQKGRIAR